MSRYTPQYNPYYSPYPPPPPPPPRRRGLRRIFAPATVLADRLFKPNRPDRATDHAVERAQLARTVLGVVATGWLMATYPLQESPGSAVMDSFTGTVMSAGLLLVIGPLALTAFVVAARPPLRARYFARLRAPLAAFGALTLGVALMWFVVAGGRSFIERGLGASPLVDLPLLFLEVWFLLPFALRSVVLCVRHTFRVADVHEVLPALIAPLLVWALFVLQLTGHSAVAAPPPVRLLFQFGPPVSVTALSLWELRRLSTRFGITLRRALGR